MTSIFRRIIQFCSCQGSSKVKTTRNKTNLKSTNRHIETVNCVNDLEKKDDVNLLENFRNIEESNKNIKSSMDVGIKDCGDLLPQKKDNRPTLVLDLDQTLVHSTFEMPRKFDFVVNVDNEGKQVIYVKLRPNTEIFLNEITGRFEIVIFTAARKEYAEFVVQELSKYASIDHVLYRESCTFQEGRYIKDLSKLGRPLNNVLLIDDIPHSYFLQPNNGVLITPFTGEENDEVLLDLLKFFKTIPVQETIIKNEFQGPFIINIGD